MKKRIFCCILLLACGIFCACGSKSETGEVGKQVITVEKDAPSTVSGKEALGQYVRFLGRTYQSGAVTYFNWSLGGFEVNFKGTGLTASMRTSLGYGGQSPENNTSVCIFVDGEKEPSNTVELDQMLGEYTLCEGLENDFHTVRVLKKQEVGYATAGLEALTVTDGKLGSKPVSSCAHRIEFIGDSLTCGDGMYTFDDCAWTSVNQDATKSHAKLIGDAFNADIQLVSKCGMGLVWDYAGNDMTRGAIPLTAIYKYADFFNNGMDTPWDFEQFQPELIVLNIGTNDMAYIGGDPERFYDTYVEFLKTLRACNPEAFILCTMGTTASTDPDPGFAQIVERVNEAGLTNMEFYLMPSDYDPVRDEPGIGIHPSPKSQKRTADYLIAEIEKALGWQAGE